MTERVRRITKQLLMSMTNLTMVMKQAEEDLAENNLDDLCKNLQKIEEISKMLREQIEIKFGVEAK